MNSLRDSRGLSAALGLLVGVTMTAAQGCDKGPIGDLAEQCGLVCPAEGILEGNASISGVQSLDAFFSAVIAVQVSAANVRASVQAELDALALSLGLERGAAAADIRAALEAKISAAIDGGLEIRYAPPACQASVEVSAKAAAECDAEVDPGSVEVKCEGSCEVDASAMVDCGAEAELVCEFTPPDLMCSGECSGSCELEAGGSCEGTCRGECSGTCSVTNAQGECEGKCEGMCTGTCELEVAAQCSGKCQGTCQVRNPEGGCMANATAKCEAMAGASVDCDAQCEGSAEPPMVKAECEASVEAKANASVECTPPSLDIGFQWSAAFAGDVDAQAEFKAWLVGFRARFSALLAASAKAELVLDSGQLLVTAAGDVVTNVASDLQAEGDLKAKIGAGCALIELDAVGNALGGAVADMEFSVSAFAEISAGVAAGG
jgi:hypothetical protein